MYSVIFYDSRGYIIDPEYQFDNFKEAVKFVKKKLGNNLKENEFYERESGCYFWEYIKIKKGFFKKGEILRAEVIAE